MRLVTGATGLVGSYVVCKLIEEGYKVRAVKRENSTTDWFFKIAKACNVSEKLISEKLEWVTGDLSDIINLEDNLQGVEKVYHCAAVVSFKKNEEEALFNTNVQGTKNLIDACLLSGVKKVLYVSSIAALSRKKDNDTIDEDSEWEDSKLNSNYARSKYMGELEVWRGQEEGLDVVIINPAFVLGFGNPEKSSSSLFKKIANGFLFYTQGINGYVDVLDVANAAVLINESEVKGERFVLVGYNISYKDLFFSIANEMEKMPPKFEIRPWMAKIAIAILNFSAKIGLRTTFVTPETINNSIRKYFYSSNKLKSKFEYKFIGKEQTIKRIVNQFKEYGGDVYK